MTVKELIKLLDELTKPDAVVEVFDPDFSEWLTITGIVYDDKTVRLYTDEL